MNHWRPFRELIPTETAFLRRLRLVSEALEVCCRPGETGFSVVEKTSEGYCWAQFSRDGQHREDDIKDSGERARAAVLEVQRLWRHRCTGAGKAACRGLCATVPLARRAKGGQR